MITKEQLTETINEITEKFGFIAQELESLWQEANSRGLTDFANRIENIQFNGYANPTQFESKLRFKDFFQIIEENEQTKNLDKFMEYKSIAESIKHLADRVDKINLDSTK